MDELKIKKINELAKKKKDGKLTEEEAREREILHREYIDAYKKNLENTLKNVVIVEKDGSKHKLEKKK